MEIQGRTVVVTGGGSGLGEATAQYLSSRGARLVVLDRDGNKAGAVAQRIGGVACAADVTDEETIRLALHEAHHKVGPLAAVVHCAGIAWAQRILGPSGMHDLETFDQVLRVNVIGTFNVVRQAAHFMTHNEPEPQGRSEGARGVLVLTASVAAFEGQIGQAAYAASKGAVASMTLPMARELARFGIRVAAIAPGIFGTPMAGGMSDKVRDSLLSQTLFPKRLGLPEEYAALAAHIIENDMINGSVLRLDGGMRMGPH
jgi:NAD(P)-dependent dehydrogenase (short-subunit alcohol dehydrogenase family)